MFLPILLLLDSCVLPLSYKNNKNVVNDNVIGTRLF